MKIDEMNIDEIKKLFSLRTLYGISMTGFDELAWDASGSNPVGK